MKSKTGPNTFFLTFMYLNQSFIISALGFKPTKEMHSKN